MRRQDKYPDTRWFHFHNANPKNRFTGDCVYRAVSEATGLSWEEVVRGLAESAIKTGYAPSSKENMDRFLAGCGWLKLKQPRKGDNTKYTGEDFCKALRKGEFIVGGDAIIANLGGSHVVCIKSDGKWWKVWDTWDSTEGCIGNWWMRKEV